MMERSRDSTIMERKKLCSAMAWEERCGHLGILLFTLLITISNKHSQTRRWYTTLLKLKPLRLLSQMVYKYSSSLIIRLRNTSRMELKRFHSLMEQSNVFSQMAKRRAFSQMELCKRYKSQVLESLNSQMVKE